MISSFILAGGSWDQETGIYSTENAGTWTVTGEYEVDGTTVEDTALLHVESAEVDYVLLEPEEDQKLTAGEYKNFTATAYDEYDNLIEDDDTNFIWEYTDKYGNFTNTEAGDYDVTATYNEVTSDPITVTVEPAEAVDFWIEPKEAIIMAGMSQEYTAWAEDKYENVFEVTENTSWYDDVEPTDESTWEENVITVNESGIWEIKGTYDDTSLNDTTNLTVDPADVYSVEIDPTENQTITAGDYILFDVWANDTYGNLVEDDRLQFDWENASRGNFTKVTAGDYEVTATYEGVTSDLTNVTVEEDDAVDFWIEPKEATITANETQKFTAYAEDEHGNVFDVTEETTWWIEDDADTEFNQTTGEVTTNVSGVWDVEGWYNGFDDSATLTVEEAELYEVVIDPAKDDVITAGVTINFTAEALDEYGNVIEDVDTEFEWMNTDEYGLFDETVPGEYNVSATYNDMTSDNVAVTVELGDADHVVIYPTDNQTITADEYVNFSATLYDSEGNEIDDDDMNFTWEYTDEYGNFTENKTGDYIVNATHTDEDISSNNVTVTVEVAEVYRVEIDHETFDGSVEAGDEIEFNATAYDEHDNLITDNVTHFDWTNIYEFNETANVAIFNMTTVGEYNVSAEYEGVASENVTVEVVPADLYEVVICPAGDQVITAGDTINFTAEALDEYGNVIENDSQEFTWADDADYIDEYGLFHETVPSDYTVNATYNDVTSDNVTVTVEIGEVDYVVIEALDETEITAGDIVNFTAAAYDSEDNLITDNVQHFYWENIGELNETANVAIFDITTAGTYDVTATYEDVTSDPIPVTVDPAEVDYVEICPDEDQVLEIDEEIEFDAWAYDEYDNLIADVVTEFEWENASSEGVFFASEEGEFNVTATYWGENEANATSEPTTVTVYDELYDLTVNTEGEGTVDVDPDEDRYVPDTNVTLTADPDVGWYFVNWTGDYEGTEEEITVTMDDDKTIIATFEEQYTLDVTIEGEGDVDIEPDQDYYDPGTEVTLTADPDEHWYFDEWTGDELGTEETLTFEMDEDKSITAWFEQHTYTLTVNIEGDGSVDIDPDEDYYEPETQVTLTADPDEGWEFDEWTGDVTGEDPTITITMDEDKSVTAYFQEVVPEEYELTISIEGEGTTDPEEGTHIYDEDEEVTITATPAEGWEFVEWIGDVTGTDSTITITMDDDKSVTANFEALDPAYFEVEITDYDDEVEEGDTVVVDFTVENTGELEGTQTIVFTVDGTEEDSVEVTLDAGGVHSGTFTWEAEEEGDYDFEVSSDDTSDSVTVTVVEEPLIPGFTTALLVVGAIIAVAIYHKKD